MKAKGAVASLFFFFLTVLWAVSWNLSSLTWG